MAEQTRVDRGRRPTSTLRVTAGDRDGRFHIAGHLGVQYGVTALVGANAEIDRLRLQPGDAPR